MLIRKRKWADWIAMFHFAITAQISINSDYAEMKRKIIGSQIISDQVYQATKAKCTQFAAMI